MATITKITRGRHENPPHGVATVKEWFNYVTAMRNKGTAHRTERVQGEAPGPFVAPGLVYLRPDDNSRRKRKIRTKL